ncbi:MAG: LacI family transcriptional regulator [Actinomycetota bacterium]|nr:LacI family transcriptional regulator [Actinomycetota bacterium]
MVNLRDVARLAGVSPATASRALAQPHMVSAARRADVERAATALGYRHPTVGAPEEAWRSLGLVVPDMENPFFAAIAKAVQRRARSAGLAVLVADTEDDASLEAEPIAQMRSLVDGIILCSPRMPDSALAELTGGPEVLLVNRRSEHLRSVVVDNRDGVRQALAHLHALGHRHVAYAGGPKASWSDAERRGGLEPDYHGIPDVRTTALGHFPPTFSGGVAAADLLIASGATAVLAHNDLVAFGLLDRLRARGIDVPSEMSVVGFDDVPAASFVSPALTTVAVPLDRLGRAAVDLLLDPDAVVESVEPQGASSAPASRLLPVSLVVRGSSGPARAVAASAPATA